MERMCLGLALYLLGSTTSMAMDIVTIEQPEYRKVLKSKAQEVQFPLSQEDKKLIAAMKTKLHGLGGVGLAAPQVNCAKRIIAIYIPEESTLLRDNVNKFYPMHIMINPSYEPIAGSEMRQDFEGCYSVSSKSGKVPRYEQITVSYYDESGRFHQQIEEGFYARVLQHEIDHLNGFLILDRLTPDCIQGSVEEMMALRRESLPPEKRALFDQVIARKAKK
ncbi:Peptide deformylase [Legionella bozemanae]|uniref:Peptide deformylase n=2 Tax=Legionella bozemanae TaxID=447 RepID=A0A0W0RJ34_LEGBO|nr:polypeptide deformylase [Legionella bozemanae]STO33231.1 Peptide deformylase [Legionella bozemanae]